MSARVRAALADWWPLLLMFAAWQTWIVAGHVARIVAPAPRDVALELAAHAGTYARAAGATLLVASAGLVGGTIVGVGLAVLTWSSPFVTGMLTLPALLVQSTPLVALTPVFARLFGYDERTVIAAAVAITFFPTFVLVAAGLRALPPGTADVFAVLGARRRARFALLALPSAVPRLFVALRISAANCILAALVAEFLMGTTGLGRLFAVAQSRLDAAAAWAACLSATGVSVAAYALGRRLERAAHERFGSAG